MIALPVMQSAQKTARRSRLATSACVLLLPALVTVAAHGAERVMLRNGFSVDCTRHEEIAAGRTRLYLAGTTENFLEVDTPQIAGVQQVADPVAVAAAHATPAAAATPSTATDASSLPSLMASAAAAHQLRAALVASIVHAESNGNAHAVSRVGAQGLMQLMPATARQMGVSDSFAPEQNLRGGTAYFDALLTRYHDDLSLALAAYNAGPAAVDRYRGVPPFRETRQYVARIIREYNRRVTAELAAALPEKRP